MAACTKGSPGVYGSFFFTAHSMHARVGEHDLVWAVGFRYGSLDGRMDGRYARLLAGELGAEPWLRDGREKGYKWNES